MIDGRWSFLNGKDLPPWVPSLPVDQQAVLLCGTSLGEEVLELQRRCEELGVTLHNSSPRDLHKIRKTCRDKGAKVVAVDDLGELGPEIRKQLSEDGVRLTLTVHLYERLTGKLLLRHCGLGPVGGYPSTRFSDRLGRVFSFVSALVGILLTLPAYPFIALAIWLDDPGPVFFYHERLGKDGRHFRLVKFRTMKPALAQGGISDWMKAGLTEVEVSRVTRVGRFLRRHRLDELPQFFNVLKGDLNVVGPRVEGKRAFEERSKLIPGYGSRLTVTPGMAGWGLMNEYGDVREKLQFDMFYIKYRSFVFDLYIFFSTALRIVRGTLK